ncbi:hypothetical protein [uncultured Kocuria sp.]|uniref:hypothetical protein n=1 Tax=uncultured Kocuria sp. TaxID=259305 RepID=UPI00259AE0AF|nr:hypothetical protein [uncultured Kocuria sp.]MCT1368175.1 hypothetical protein [Rothia sp. p3-SID1597]
MKADSDVHTIDSSDSPRPLVDGRRSSAWLRISTWLGFPMSVLGAAWITAGRALFGAGGSLMVTFLVSVGPLFLVVMLVATWRIRRDASRYEARATSGTVASLQVITWVLAAIFGFLIPDRLDGRTVSALSQTFGADLVGLSAGFGNTFGILTFVAAFATLIVAFAQDRFSTNKSSGRPATEDELLDSLNYNDGEY